MPVSIHFHVPRPPHPEGIGEHSPNPAGSGRPGGPEEHPSPTVHPPSTPAGEGSSAVPPGRSGGGSTPPELAAGYALETIPASYGTTNTPGVYQQPNGGPQFIVQDGKAYPVRYDSGNQTWRMVQPGNPTNPGIPVRRNADGSWSTHDEVGLKGGNVSDADHASHQLEMRRTQILHDTLQAEASMIGQIQQNSQMVQEVNMLRADLHEMEHGLLAPEVWGNMLPQTRQQLTQVTLKLQEGIHILQDLTATLQQLQQHLQHVEYQLHQLN